MVIYHGILMLLFMLFALVIGCALGQNSEWDAKTKSFGLTLLFTLVAGCIDQIIAMQG